MKILLLTTHLNMGGIGIYTVNLARYLAKAGASVTVASSGGDLEGRLREEGVEHFHLDIKTKTELGPAVWKALPRLNRLVRDGGYDILHAQTRVAQVLACVSGKITGRPYISTCHGFFRYKRLGRKLFPCWGDRVIAISESVRRHLVDDFGFPAERVKLVFNGIELENYPSGGPEKDTDLLDSIGLARDATVIGSVGRLSSVKGYKYLVAAFGDLTSGPGRLQLLIVGDGPEKDILREQVSRLGLDENVFMVPGGASLGKYLGLMDVFCLPSVHEGLGLALMEAMASGRACVASDVGGLSELITHEKDGLLVPPEDPRALSESIARLTNDVSLRESFGKKAREKAARNFSIEESVTKTMEVYREVIAG